tara:strand:+ start:2643 stop:5861 length:3219 start_codon:yes stop_codon:yes gene_type:complete
MAKKFDFLSPGVQIREIDQSFIPTEAEAEGPIIIGRTRKGPANKPVRVRNLDDFVSVFGLPVAGGNGNLGDVWREGNTVGPTYASYAAQSWLASEQSPVTVVRLAGEQHSDVGSGGEAGWQVGASPIGSTGANSTAYGLFVLDETDTGELTFNTITISGNSMADGSHITISDGDNPAVRFEFESGGGVTAGAVPITFATLSHATIAANLAAAIETQAAAGNLNVAIDYNTGDETIRIAVTHTTGGTITRDASGCTDDGSGTLNAATRAAANGSLAAVLYCVTGALSLKGKLADGGSDISLAGSLIESVGANAEFQLEVHSAAGSSVETINFDFNRSSAKYIRNVLNTNPQLTNSTLIETADQKTYWLGESFVNHLETNVTLTNPAGQTYAILLPLGDGLAADPDAASANWGYQRYGAREAKSGWVFSDRLTGEKKLFRFKSLHVGEDIQRNYLIAIEDIRLASNPSTNAYGSFSVCFKDLAGNTIEKYSGCNLNPASPNYVAARIGDQYQEWSDADRRYRTYGDFQNQSNLFYIEMNDTIVNGGGQGLSPAGFFGPVRPKGFGLVNGEKTPKSLDLSSDFAGALARVSDDSNLFKGHGGGTGEVANLGDTEAIRLEFPKLRMRDNGTDGGSVDQARSYWGVRPKVSANSNTNDPDYIDYTRAFGMSLTEEAGHQSPPANFEYSFIFSLDDVSGSTATGIWSWASGNYGSGASFTSKSNQNYGDLLEAGVKQFIMPVWGGSEGFDITEMEPLRNDLIATAGNLAERTNYVDYTISKALDSISDSEVVPANLLVMPGIYKAAATNKMINIAESRRDILSIIDLEHDYVPRAESKSNASTRLGDVTQAITKLKSRNLNSSYACCFYPAVQVSDNLNANQLVWIPSSVAALGALGRSQAQSELWFAPAGFNRGGLGALGGSRGPRVVQARQRLDSKERDALYEQNINPIATFPAEGVVIFGQKTLQADQSALDRINVRRLLLFLKSRVNTISRNLLFDQNVQSTWNRFKNQVEPVLADTQARFGLSGYKLVLDSSTTTADLIDRNIMYAKIFVKPARAIEYIVVDFVITRTGADFV